MNAEQKAKQLITDAKQKAQERFEQLKSANFPYELRGVEQGQESAFWRKQYIIYSNAYFTGNALKNHFDVMHNDENAMLRAWKQAYIDFASGLVALPYPEPQWMERLEWQYVAKMVMQYCDEKIKQL